MKKLLLLFLTGFLFLYYGCDSDGGTGTGGLGGGGGGTGNVTFTIGQRPGDQGGIMFTARPSVAVTLTQFTISLPAQQLSDPYQGDGQTVYQPGQSYDLSEYNGVASGQQWTFNFKGKIGNAQGQAFDVNANYTVP